MLKRFDRRIACVVIYVVLSFGTVRMARADPTIEMADINVLSDLRDVEVRMDRIGNGLAAANVALCRHRQPDTGMVLHTLDSYARTMRDTVRSYFGFDANLAILAVRPGSAAERAGLLANDSIVAINGAPTGPSVLARETSSGLVDSYRRIASLAPNLPITLTIIRDKRPQKVIIYPTPVCRARFELVASPRFEASSDGEMVQITTRFFATLNDTELAVLIAHELAHNILEHPRRLAAQKVQVGILAGFGRNVGYFRQTETQADVLSVSLLANAGLPPTSAATFWSSVGRRVLGGAFTSRSHPSWKDRAATTANEARRLSGIIARPIISDILKTRDVALDGNWQTILVRAGRSATR